MTNSNSQLPDWDIRIKSPGRVNLLGEHVDYNQGIVLPIAIDRCVSLAVRPRSDGMVTVQSLDLDQQVEFDLKDLDRRVDAAGKPLPRWALYPAGVAWSLMAEGLDVHGLDAVMVSEVPMGAGLSSSAAVEVAFGLAWQALAGWEVQRMRLAQLCQRAENSYVGIHCGLMDQFACAHGVARHALLFDVRSLTWQPLPMPPDCAVVVADSGTRRELAVSAYNQRRQDCDMAVSLLKESLPRIQSLREVSPAQLEEFGEILPEDVHKRARHVVQEIGRVGQACQCLLADDTVGFGQLMLASHASLRDLFEVSLPELDGLVRIAMGIDGCYGARLTGAGFGGCTVNLVEGRKAQAFTQALREQYQQEFGRQANIYLCQAGRGAHLVGE